MSLHVVIRGRVQGVGFRWWARAQAQELGLAGWVRNRADGAVEVLADGDSAALDAFRARVRHGPSGAEVTAVEPVQDGAHAPPAKPFSIVR